MFVLFMKESFSITTDHDMRAFGERFSGRISGGTVLLYGDLGAGKTTFTQGFAKGLGIKNRIISPTFTIMRQYDLHGYTSGNDHPLLYFYHIDLYRIQDDQDLYGLGLKEILMEDTNIIVIEWPERLGTLFPSKRWDVHIDGVGDNERRVVIEYVE